MKIAIWRYGLPYQHASNSTVGGGLISQTVTAALSAHHELHLVGKASKEVAVECERVAQSNELSTFAGYHPDATDLAGYDAAVILTGPANGLYAGYAKTYELLDGFKGHSIYCQWDCALPFNFAPKPVSGVEMPSPMSARWTLLTQVPSHLLGTRRPPPEVDHEQCFFELCELDQQWLGSCRAQDVIPRIGYFGGDRPGRMKELKRWVAADVPFDIYGRWSDKSIAKLKRPNVEFKGPIPEGQVAERLNQYAMTIYIADSAYVKQDFVAQRLLENARAGVPVAYSDMLQPSVKKMLLNTHSRNLIVSSPMELRTRFAAILESTTQQRRAVVTSHQKAVKRIRTWKHGYTVAEAFETILPT